MISLSRFLILFAPPVVAGDRICLASRRPDVVALAPGVPIGLLAVGFALPLGAMGAGRR